MFLPLGDDVQRDKPPFVGLAIILACVLVWIQSCKVDASDPLPYHNKLMQWFYTWGVSGADLQSGRFHGLFTHMFVHGDFLHLLGNMIAFWAFVWTLEAVLGGLQFGILYLVCGLAAGGVHAYMSGGSEIPLVGASGAIAGVIGAYCLKFGPTTNIKCLVFFFGRPFRVSLPAATFAGVWVLTQLHGQLTSGSHEGGGVAWLAHLVGFVAGSIMMPLLYDESRGRLTTDKDGTLVVVASRDKPVPDHERPFALDHEAETTVCQGCDRELDHTCRVSPGLWMCPNPDCKRLCYATAKPRPEPDEEPVPV